MSLSWSAHVPSGEVLDGGDFEIRLARWLPIGGVDLELSDQSRQGGCCACLVSKRTAEWNGVGQYLTGELIPGRTYSVSAWAKLVGAEEDVFTLKLRQIDARWSQTN